MMGHSLVIIKIYVCMKSGEGYVRIACSLYSSIFDYRIGHISAREHSCIF